MNNNDQHKDSELFEKMFDNVLDDALFKMAAEHDPSLPDDEPVEFSEEHKRKIEQIFNRAKKRERKLIFRNNVKRAAICAAVFLLLLAITAMSVGAVRNRVLNFFHNTEETNTKIGISNEFIEETYSDENITMNYIPYGFSLEKKQINFGSFDYKFSSEMQYYIIHIINMSNYSGNYTIDTEKAEIERMMINENDCYYIENSNGKTIIINNGEKTCTIQGDIEKDEIIKIAQNLEIK